MSDPADLPTTALAAEDATTLRLDTDALAALAADAKTIAVTAPAQVSVNLERTGDMIGRYKLDNVLGEGGFGVVWRAEQSEPIHREVALKVIKPGMDSREIIARFEAERQALALMDHPNIAGVLDAGTTDNGRPFFVMELVKGVPITDYCDAHQLTIRQRLELFIPVCQAVQHAHQKAILHRDLKPSNILVTEVDGKPVPKVIDFGIAKALHATSEPALHATLAQTLAGMVIGTPQYMSPEQAGSMPDVDTRSDIYTLGVILYELLVGETPLSREQMKRAALDEVLRLVRESEPRRPSSKFTPATELTRTTATLRHTDSKKLGHALRGDLDWIMLKALEKDRSRRYDTANDFALDLRRHLDDEPVSAGPPSAGYRLRKLVRRNKLTFGATLAILVTLIAGVTVSTWQAMRATRAESETEAKNTVLKRQLEEAARTDRLSANDLIEQGRGPDGLAHLARAQTYKPDTVLGPDRAMLALNDWRFPLPRAVCQGHEGSVRSVQFSSDGQRIVTASDDKTARVWESTSGKLLTTLAHGDRVNSAQFSPDGLLIVTASHDKTARVWESGSGKLLATLAHGDQVNSAQFSPDGLRIVTAAGSIHLTSKDNTARVWEGASGKLLATLSHESGVHSAQFSPDGLRIVTAAGSGVTTAPKDNTARVWESGTGKLLATLGHEGSVNSAQFSPDGLRIVTAAGSLTGGMTARICESGSGKLLVTLSHANVVWSAQFSPDGLRIVTTSRDNTVRVWESASGKLLVTLSHLDLAKSAHFSPDGQRIVTTSIDNTARVWESASGELLATLGHEGSVNSAQFSSDGQRIVTASNDKTARVWGSASSKLLADLQGHQGFINSVQFSPDCQCIVTASHDKTARVWESGSGKLLATLRHADSVSSAQFSPDGERIVTASNDKTARMWESTSGKLLTTLGHKSSVNSAQFSPDGLRIVTSSHDKTARVWESGSGKLLATLAHGDQVNRAQFSPDGLRIVTAAGSRIIASKDNTARVWESANGKLLATLGHERGVNSAQFSPDGLCIVTASHDKTARVWESGSGKLLATLGHESSVNSAQFSPDGLRIVTAMSLGKAARVWESGSGKLLFTLGRESYINSAQYSSDSLRIVTNISGFSVWVWELLGTSAPPPPWFADFLRLMAQRKFNDDGELVIMPVAEVLALRVKIGSIVATERSRYAAIARCHLTPADKRPPRPGINNADTLPSKSKQQERR